MTPEAESAPPVSAEALAPALLAALRPTLFESGRLVSPRRAGQLAATFAGSFQAYSADEAGDTAARAFGQQLAHEGLGHSGALALVAALHQQVDAGPSADRRRAVAYCGALLAGYMAAREALILREQEQTREALQRARAEAGH